MLHTFSHHTCLIKLVVSTNTFKFSAIKCFYSWNRFRHMIGGFANEINRCQRKWKGRGEDRLSYLLFSLFFQFCLLFLTDFFMKGMLFQLKFGEGCLDWDLYLERSISGYISTFCNKVEIRRWVFFKNNYGNCWNVDTVGLILSEISKNLIITPFLFVGKGNNFWWLI